MSVNSEVKTALIGIVAAAAFLAAAVVAVSPAHSAPIRDTASREAPVVEPMHGVSGIFGAEE